MPKLYKKTSSHCESYASYCLFASQYNINMGYYLYRSSKISLYLFRTPLVENDIRVSVQGFADSRECIYSMFTC